MARQTNPLDEVLSRLKNVRKKHKGWSARCPAHEDRANSLSVAVTDDGKVLLRCFAGCSTESIVAALGMAMRDLFPAAEGRGASYPTDGTATAQQPGLGLVLYAEAKRLPVEFLQSLGVTEITYLRSPAIRVPYCDEQGEEVAIRFRIALSGDSRFKWKTGAKPCLYGLSRLHSARQAGHIILCEGESDAQTLWLHDVPALGLPGASAWREEWAEHLDEVETVYVVVEPDQGGEATREWISRSKVRRRVWLLDFGEHKDVSGLYLDDPDAFRERLAAVLRAAVPWSQREAEARDEHEAWAWGLCEPLAQSPRILDGFAEELANSGVAGESRVAKLLYLAVTSRLLPQPVSVAVKGPSSAGKSYLAQRVLDYFPPQAYYALSAMSERALAYSEEPLSHRILVVYEAAGLQGDFASYLMRSLLSEGRVRYETVEKTKAGLRPRLIEREGPTGLIVTTTAVSLHPENETRLLSVTVTDTPEQTRSVLLSLADGSRGPVDVSRWRALQEWLEIGERRVLIPFAQALAEAIPPVAVRLRRDFGAVLSLLRTHALLHRANRQRDAHGQIIATLDDYSAVRVLVADLVADGVEASVPPVVRETVEAVAAVQHDGEGVTVLAVAAALGLDKSSASRRIKAAVAKGYLKNLETGKGKSARLVPGEPLPEEIEVLPRPERLGGCAVAEDSAGIDTPTPSAPAVSQREPDSCCPRCGLDLFWIDRAGRYRCVRCDPSQDSSQVTGWHRAGHGPAVPAETPTPEEHSNDGR